MRRFRIQTRRATRSMSQEAPTATPYSSLSVPVNEFFEVLLIIAGELADDVTDAFIEGLSGFILIKGPQEDVIFILPHFEGAHFIGGVFIRRDRRHFFPIVLVRIIENNAWREGMDKGKSLMIDAFHHQIGQVLELSRIRARHKRYVISERQRNRV